MAIKVTGSTDISGAVSMTPQDNKTVCIVARGVGNNIAEANKVFGVYGSTDAISKWGEDAKAVKLTETLIKNKSSNIKGIIPAPADTESGQTDADMYEKAFAKLLLEDGIDIIILDTYEDGIVTKLKEHLTSAEAEDKFRYAVVGTSVGKTTDEVKTIANTINHKRVFLASPCTVDMTNTALDGIYVACAVAGAIAVETRDPALPMNGVKLMGFGGVERVALSTEYNTLVGAGIVPIGKTAGNEPYIYRLVTTYTKDANNKADTIWQEGSTVFITDDVLNAVITRIRTNYKRTKNVARLYKSMRTDVINILSTKQGLEIIDQFDPNTVIVRKDPQDILGAIIEYDYNIVTPLYNIRVKQHAKL